MTNTVHASRPLKPEPFAVLEDAQTRATLRKLHAQSRRDMPRIARGFLRSLGRRLQPHHMRDAYISIGPEQGRWLHDAVVSKGATNIVEFGASFGISATWLGAAARKTGGRVVTTEIEPGKIAVADDNLRAAGLDDVVTLLGGDALETLQSHEGPVDFLFFDGWADVNQPLLALLEPKLARGCTLVVDNANFPGTARFVRALAARPGWQLAEGPDRRTAVAMYAGGRS